MQGFIFTWEITKCKPGKEELFSALAKSGAERVQKGCNVVTPERVTNSKVPSWSEGGQELDSCLSLQYAFFKLFPLCNYTSITDNVLALHLPCYKMAM